MIKQAGITQKPNGDPFEELPRELEETFREFWTDNANKVSLLYSGTGALKVDFTRTGKRTKAGELEDGKRAVSRYFINNFYDVYNQNALDLVLGKIKHHDLNTIARHSPTSTLGTAFTVHLC
jgi:phosphatidylinositol 4-phosphatase